MTRRRLPTVQAASLPDQVANGSLTVRAPTAAQVTLLITAGKMELWPNTDVWIGIDPSKAQTAEEKFAAIHAAIVALMGKVKSGLTTPLRSFTDLANLLAANKGIGTFTWLLLAASFYQKPSLSSAGGTLSITSLGSTIPSPFPSEDGWDNLQLKAGVVWDRGQGNKPNHLREALVYSSLIPGTTNLRLSGAVFDTSALAGDSLKFLAMIARPLRAILEQSITVKLLSPAEAAGMNQLVVSWIDAPSTVWKGKPGNAIIAASVADVQTLRKKGTTGAQLDPLGVFFPFDRLSPYVSRQLDHGKFDAAIIQYAINSVLAGDGNLTRDDVVGKAQRGNLSEAEWVKTHYAPEVENAARSLGLNAPK